METARSSTRRQGQCRNSLASPHVEANNAGAVHTHSVPGTVLSHHYEDQGGVALEGWDVEGAAASTPRHQHQHPCDQQQSIDAGTWGCYCTVLPSAPNGFLVAGHGLCSWGNPGREQTALGDSGVSVKLTRTRSRSSESTTSSARHRGHDMSVTFVSETLFPFAERELSHYVKEHERDSSSKNRSIQDARSECVWMNLPKACD